MSNKETRSNQRLINFFMYSVFLLVAIFGLCFVCAFISALSNDIEAVSQENTTQPIPTNTPLPTPIPLPTSTPFINDVSRLASLYPDYIKKSGEQYAYIIALSASLDSDIETILNEGQDSSKFDLVEFTRSLETVVEQYKILEDLNPPAEVTKFHTELVNNLGICANTANSIMEAARHQAFTVEFFQVKRGEYVVCTDFFKSTFTDFEPFLPERFQSQ